MIDRMIFAESVARALATRTPVVALETTGVTHGLPHPDGGRLGGRPDLPPGEAREV